MAGEREGGHLMLVVPGSPDTAQGHNGAWPGPSQPCQRLHTLCSLLGCLSILASLVFISICNPAVL